MVGATITVMPYRAKARPRFSGGNDVRQNRLRHGLQSAAARALQDAERK